MWTELVEGLLYHRNDDGTYDLRFGTINVNDLAKVCNITPFHAFMMLGGVATVDPILDAIERRECSIYPAGWIEHLGCKYRPTGSWLQKPLMEVQECAWVLPDLPTAYKELVQCN